MNFRKCKMFLCSFLLIDDKIKIAKYLSTCDILKLYNCISEIFYNINPYKKKYSQYFIQLLSENSRKCTTYVYTVFLVLLKPDFMFTLTPF